MIPKITLLELSCLLSGAAILICLIVFPIAVFKKRKAGYRAAFAAATIAALGWGFSYIELDRIHGLLFRGEYRVKTKADLLDLFGKPTRMFSEDFRGEKIDAWVYKVDLISPKLVFQFEFHGDAYQGSVGSN